MPVVEDPQGRVRCVHWPAGNGRIRHHSRMTTTTTPPTSAIAIRPIQAGDYEAWLPLWNGYLAFYGTVMPEADGRYTFDRLCAGERLHGFVAEVGGTVSGIVHCLFHPSTWTPTDYCYLQDLYVDPACRGAGAGRALIRAVVDFARDRDANRVIWLTNEDNATARALYDTVARTTGLIQYRISPL